MAMPPNPSPTTDRWWSDFHRGHGKDSEAEKAFLGYLSSRGWHPFALTAAQLDAALVAFQAFVATAAAPAQTAPPAAAASPALVPPYPRYQRRR